MNIVLYSLAGAPITLQYPVSNEQCPVVPRSLMNESRKIFSVCLLQVILVHSVQSVPNKKIMSKVKQEASVAKWKL